MKRIHIIIGAGVAAAGWGLAGAASAQKGMGETEGVARQADLPELVSMSGTLQSIESHRCGQTTGRAMIGTHLMLQTADEEKINLHVGPTDDVAPRLEGVEPGQQVRFQGFRTSAMPEDAYVAQQIEVNDQQIEFRDPDTLRPFWAGRYPESPGARWGGHGRGKGRGPWPGMGKGMGPGMKQGMGQGMQRGMNQGEAGSPMQYGPCWW